MRAVLNWLVVVGAFVGLMAWCALLMAGALLGVMNLPLPGEIKGPLLIVAALAAVAVGIWSVGKVVERHR